MNFDVRKTLLEYDDVLRQQRETIYDQRDYILEHQDVHELIREMFDRVIEKLVRSHVEIKNRQEEVNVEGLLSALAANHFGDITLSEEDIKGKSVDEVVSHAKQLAWDSYEAKIEPFKAHGLSLEKNIVLSIVDRSWQEHIDTMSKLREGIHLRSYAQNKPLQAYIAEGYELFEDMLQSISQEGVSVCIRMKVEGRSK